MDATEDSSDIVAIKAIVARQFASLSWGAGKAPAWSAFEADFHPGAALYGAARPAQPQSPAGFVERMRGLAGSTLRSFDEAVLGCDVRVFGNVAVAVAACETLENELETNRNVEMLLLIKDAGHWMIVAQAWDKAGPLQPVPNDLLTSRTG